MMSAESVSAMGRDSMPSLILIIMDLIHTVLFMALTALCLEPVIYSHNNPAGGGTLHV